MTQYEDRVERQRLLIKAEEWSKSIKALHNHSLNSMWYDSRPQDTEDGKRVTDIEYNSGLIQRTCSDGGLVYFGKELKGDELIDSYIQNNQK